MNPCPERAGLRRWSPPVLAGLLFVLTLALFWPARNYAYINLDDYPYVADNPMVATGLSSAGIRSAFTTIRENWWLPLLWISYMGDVEAFGPGPRGHHLTNMFLHALNAALLFWALWRLTGSCGRSLFVAALFAWHPTRVEAVAWIAARKDVLSGLFFMLALLAYARHAARPGGKWLAAVFGLMLAGLMSKAVLVFLPLLLLVLDGWPLRRAPLSGPGFLKSWQPLVREKLPLFGLALAFIALNLWTHVAGRGDGAVTLAQRLGLLAPNIWAYVAKIVVPLRLNVMVPENDTVNWLGSAAATLALVGVLTLAYVERGRRPWLLAGSLWFLLALAPILRGVRLGLAQHADRWTYLPLIGAGIALAWTVGEWGRGPARRWLAGGAVVLLLACAARTNAQLAWWRDSLTLFQRAAHLAPGHPVVRNSLGQALVEAGRTAEGAVHLQAALQLEPDNPEYRSNLGVALLRLGRAEEALALHEEAIRLQPAGALFHNNRGNALTALGREAEAGEAYAAALRLQPDHAEAHFNLGSLLFRSGRTEEARSHFEAAVRARPGVALNWFNLGMAEAQLGRMAEARACVERALQIDPGLPGGEAARARLRWLAF